MFPRRHGHAKASMPAKPPSLSLATTLLCTSAIILSSATLSGARRWLLSGCGLESILLLYGARSGTRVFVDIPLWTLLSTLNLVYAVCATSWLLYLVFCVSMLPIILLTSLLQFDFAADLARRYLRLLLKQLHFTRDKIALFNLPAMEIDTEVDGLLVIRGVTIQLSTLTLVAHGIELGKSTPQAAPTSLTTLMVIGIKLTKDLELGAHCEQVTIRLFREIAIGDVSANIKGGVEMTLAEQEEETAEADDDDSIFASTSLLRTATAGSLGFKDRPKLRESLTGTRDVKDTSAEDGLANVTTLSPDDAEAEKQYRAILADIRRTGPIYQARAGVIEKAQASHEELASEGELLAAICTGMHEFPSVPHPPDRSVRVTTLQNLSSPSTRRFLHRLPFLLRLLLNVLSYFHSISFASISATASGKW
jgi:hypothetical protein